MKANELMIGDWVNTPNGISRVIYIAKYSGIYTDNTDVGEKLYSPHEINPIPLTPEILEKNGWKKDSGGEECWANSKGWFTPHEYGKRDTIKSWEVEICGKPNSFDGVIKYVHELQHALRLCGIEKEIIL